MSSHSLHNVFLTPPWTTLPGIISSVLHLLFPTHAQEPHSDLARSSILDILARISEVPNEWKTVLRNNGGGFVNHIFYWSTMCPNPEQSQRLPKVSMPLVLQIVYNIPLILVLMVGYNM